MASGILKVTLALSHKLKLDRGCVKLNPLAAYGRKEPRPHSVPSRRPSALCGHVRAEHTLGPGEPWQGSLGRGVLTGPRALPGEQETLKFPMTMSADCSPAG